jgi:hypothetical protein
MARWLIAGLIVLNLVLGVAVYLRLGGERAAQAQIGGARGDYSVVAGNGSNNTSIVYILDASTGRLLALRTDPVNHKVDYAGGKIITTDLASQR